jgi:hypothetical protein
MQRPGERKNHGQRIKALLRPERTLPALKWKIALEESLN